MHEITWNGIHGPVTGDVTGKTDGGYLVADVGDGKVVLVHPKSVIREEHGERVEAPLLRGLGRMRGGGGEGNERRAAPKGARGE